MHYKLVLVAIVKSYKTGRHAIVSKLNFVQESICNSIVIFSLIKIIYIFRMGIMTT